MEQTILKQAQLRDYAGVDQAVDTLAAIPRAQRAEVMTMFRTGREPADARVFVAYSALRPYYVEERDVIFRIVDEMDKS